MTAYKILKLPFEIMENNGVENILKATGLSCDDLIKKLLQYKTLKQPDDENDNTQEEYIANKIEILKANQIESFKKNKIEPQETNKVEFSKNDFAKSLLKNGVESLAKNDNESSQEKYKTISTKIINSNENESVTNNIKPIEGGIIRYEDDEIREKIKEQIKMLRAGKKSEFIKITTAYNPNATYTYKKRYVPNKDTQFSISLDEVKETNQDVNNSSPLPLGTSNLSEALINNESTIKIVDVQSGLEAVTLKGNGDVIKPTKTSDITKIKGWKNKKFKLNETINVDLTSKEGFDHLQPLESIIDNCNKATGIFVSNNLDEFLAEFTNLDVSNDIDKVNSGDCLEMDNKFYPKSVEIIRQNQNYARKYVKKPRTVAEKRKADKLAYDNMMKNKLNEICKTRKRNACAYYNGNPIQICSMNPEKHIKIEDTVIKKSKESVVSTNKEENNKKRLLNSVRKKSSNKLKYKPGPLSKKDTLQITDQNKYKTVIKNLPPIVLDVTPEIGKIFHPNIDQYINFSSYELTNDRIDFALSALKSKTGNDEKQTFHFNVPYKHNQDKIKLYKKIYMLPILPKTKSVNNNNILAGIDDIVKGVVTDMVNYVELKEIASSLIHDDDEIYENLSNENVYTNIENCSPENFEIIPNKRTPKQIRTSLEFKRLNIKVIEVDIETENNIKDCKKPYCKLGCVCNSLNSHYEIKDHCGKYNCMFNCDCNFMASKQINSFGSKVILPAGTDLLSNGTVDQLENHIKKDLAKVEKEFIQTVIQANNQTIIVGNSFERKKRVSKAPKKLQDFVDPNDAQLQFKTPNNLKECFVNVEKLDLSHIVPYCMLHDKYNCQCLVKKEQLVNNKFVVQVKKSSKTPPKRKLIETIIIPSIEPKILQLNGDTGDSNKKKRKQTFDSIRTSPTFLYESQKEPALQRRKKRVRQIINSPCNKNDKIFDEIHNNPNFMLNSAEFYTQGLLKILLKKNRDMKSFRMIPWKIFCEYYYKNHLYIWCPVNNSGRILVTANSRMPVNNMVDVKLRNDSMIPSLDFLKWLKKRQLPPNKNPDQLSVVLTLTNIAKCWEIFAISSICRKAPSLTTAIEMSEKLKFPSAEHLKYAKLKLYASSKGENFIETVSLPRRSEFVKWKKIHLKSNFTYILNLKYNFSVKYNVLLRMAREAVDFGNTVKLSPSNNKNTVPENFGIYCVPECENTVFIGPYQIHEEEDYQTLRYLNGELINTDTFHKMLNKPTEKKNVWLYSNPIFTYMFEYTENQNNSVLKNSKYNNAANFAVRINNDVNLCQEIIGVNHKQKFIISNVPNLGYIEAYESQSSTIIFWPEDEKPKTFATSKIGLLWLKFYFEIFLTSLPLHFNIAFNMVTNKPNLPKLTLSKIITFPLIGKFGGTDNINDNLKEILLIQGITETDLKNSLRQRAQKALLIDCSQIANDLSIPKTIKFSRIADFAECLHQMILELQAENEVFIEKRRPLKHLNLTLKHYKKTLEMQVESLKNRKRKLQIENNNDDDIIIIEDFEKRRESNALNQLKANDEIQIETMSSVKDKIVNKPQSNKIETEKETICIDLLDSDDEDPLAITSPPLSCLNSKPSIKPPNKFPSKLNNSILISPKKAIAIPLNQIKSFNILKPLIVMDDTKSKNASLLQSNHNNADYVNGLSPSSTICSSISTLKNRSAPVLNNDCKRDNKTLLKQYGNHKKNSMQFINNFNEKIVQYKQTMIGGKLVNLKLFPPRKY